MTPLKCHPSLHFLSTPHLRQTRHFGRKLRAKPSCTDKLHYSICINKAFCELNITLCKNLTECSRVKSWGGSCTLPATPSLVLTHLTPLSHGICVFQGATNATTRLSSTQAQGCSLCGCQWDCTHIYHSRTFPTASETSLGHCQQNVISCHL